MELNIAGQYKHIAKEQARIKKMIEKNDQRLLLLKKYLKHVEDVKISRGELRAGKVYTLEEVEKRLGLK